MENCQCTCQNINMTGYSWFGTASYSARERYQ